MRKKILSKRETDNITRTRINPRKQLAVTKKITETHPQPYFGTITKEMIFIH